MMEKRILKYKLLQEYNKFYNTRNHVLNLEVTEWTVTRDTLHNITVVEYYKGGHCSRNVIFNGHRLFNLIKKYHELES